MHHKIATTRCPHCRTAFRVRREQLDAAAGQVRCGSCLRIFAAPENMVSLPEPPLVPETPLVPTELAATAIDDAPDTPDPGSETLATPVTAAEADDPTDPVTTSRTADQPPPAPTAQAAEPDQASAGSLTLPSTPTAPPAPDTEPAERNRVTSGGVRRELDALTNRYLKNRQQRWAWRFAALGLTLLLIGQLGYGQRALLSQWPVLAPAYAPWCDDCSISSAVYPSDQIQALSTGVQPTDDGALRFDAIIVNRGDHAIAYPALVLRLYQMNGELAADGRFQPEDYLQPQATEHPRLLPGRPVSLSLRLNRPVAEPANFRVAFAPPEQEQATGR